MAARNSIILISISINSTLFTDRKLCDFLWCRFSLAPCNLRLGCHFDVDEDGVACALVVLLKVIVALGRVRTATSECLQAYVQAVFVFL